MENRKVGIWLGLGIFFLPIIFCWFTLRKGYSKKSKVIAFIWLILLTCLSFISNPLTSKENKIQPLSQVDSASTKKVIQPDDDKNKEYNYFVSSVRDGLKLNNKPALAIDLCEKSRNSNCITVTLNNTSMANIHKSPLKNYQGDNQNFIADANIDGHNYSLSNKHETGVVLKLVELNSQKLTLTFFAQFYSKVKTNNPYIKFDKATFSTENPILIKALLKSKYDQQSNESENIFEKKLKASYIDAKECKTSRALLKSTDSILTLFLADKEDLSNKITPEEIETWVANVGNPKLKAQSEKFYDATRLHQNSLSKEIYIYSRLQIVSVFSDYKKYVQTKDKEFLYKIRNSLKDYMALVKLTNKYCKELPIQEEAIQSPTPSILIKMSRSGICHSPGSRWYSRTKNYTSYNSMDECIANGGRYPKG